MVLMVAPAWRGFGDCSRTTPNPRNRTGGTRFGSPSPETLMSIIHELPGVGTCAKPAAPMMFPPLSRNCGCG